jgi:hypothetical protein
MSGPQKGIYDEARRFVQTQESNFLYVDSADVSELTAALADPLCFKGNRIQQTKTQLETLKERLDDQVRQRRAQAIQTLDAMRTRMQSMDEYQTLPDIRQTDLDKPYQDLIDHIGQQQLIAVINDRLRYFEEQGYQKILARMVELATPKPRPAEVPDKDLKQEVAEPRIRYIPARQIQVVYDKAWLADESDVDRYLESMREALLEAIRAGKRIQI